MNRSLCYEVRRMRVELTQDYSHYPLKVARLPFRHLRFQYFN